LTLELKDLHFYLQELESEYPGELVKIYDKISAEYEVTAYWKILSEKNEPVIFFSNVDDKKFPVVVNIFGKRSRVARIIGADEKSFYSMWLEKIQKPLEPVLIDSGPVKDFKKFGSDVDLTELPLLKYFVEDGGKYITSGIVVANDPESGIVNLSFARMQLKTKNKLGVSLHSRGNLWRYFQKAVEKGLPWLEVAVVIGCHPAIYLAAATRQNNEYRLAGALTGEPVVLTKCETKNIYIPANSEIVLEGRILTDMYEDEGPFSEFTGYVSGRSTRNIMVVDCVTHRKDAIYQTIIPSNSAEHLLLGGLPMQASYYADLRKTFPQVRDINFPVWGCHFVAIISVDKKGNEGVQIRAAMHLIGENPYAKYVIVVDEDVDVYDEKEVLWTVATRTQPHRSFHILPISDGSMLDPSQENPGITGRLIIDATRPPHWDKMKVKTPSIPDDVFKRVLGKLNRAERG